MDYKYLAKNHISAPLLSEMVSHFKIYDTQTHCMIHRHHFNIIGDYEQRNSTKTRMD